MGCTNSIFPRAGPCPLTFKRDIAVQDELNVGHKIHYGKPKARPTMRQSISVADAHFDTRRQSLCARMVGTPMPNDETEASISNTMSPHEAMHSILQHLHLDSDGGLVNLDNDLEDHGQTSKVKHMHRGLLHIAMALVFVFRLVLNIGKVGHFAGMHSVALFLFEDHSLYLNAKYSRVTYANIFGASNHISELVVVVSALEGAAMVIFLCVVLWNIFGACWSSAHLRCIKLAVVFWTDLPRLASLSAMTAMSYVHPNLLIKNSKTFHLREKACRALLEAFFRGRLDGYSNEEFAVQVAKIIFSRDNLDRKRDNDLAGLNKAQSSKLHDKVNAFIDSGPVKCYKALQEEFGSMDKKECEELLKYFDVDLSVLDRTGRLMFVNMVELSYFGLVVAACFAVGIAGLTAKLAEGAVTLISTTESDLSKLFWIAAFLNQVISVLTIKELLVWRVETFIFGGCDAVITAEEDYIIRTYRGHLLEKIWSSTTFTLCDKLCLTLNLDDDDLQQLVVEEDIRAKQGVIASVRKFLKAT